MMPDEPAPEIASANVPVPVPEVDAVDPVAPVTRSERLRALDAVRGVAVLGILAVNIFTLGLPLAGAMNPALAGGEPTAPNLFSWFAVDVLFDGKFRAIFSMLFGAGAILLLDRAEGRGAGIRAADVYYRRTLWLVFFGLVHAYFIWWGDVLFWYGVFGLALFPFRRRSPAFLIAVGVLLLALHIPQSVIDHLGLVSMRDRSKELIAAANQGKTLTEDERAEWWAWEQKKRELNPPPGDLERDVDGQRGGWWKVFRRRIDMAARMQSTGVYRYGLADVCSMMLIGMGLMKLGVFSGGLSNRAYRWIALIAYGVGLPLSVYVARQTFFAEFDVLETSLLRQCVFPFARLAVALGHVAIVMLAWRTRWLCWLTAPLAAVGQMALTNYVLQSVYCTAIFDGWGLSWFGKLQRHELLYVVLAVWGTQLLVSPIWLQIFRFGPLEWLWRVLTYWKWQSVFRWSDTGEKS
jgi:uncharacterized protein